MRHNMTFRRNEYIIVNANRDTKLTIAVNRVSLKIPEGTSYAKQEQYKAIADKIAKQVDHPFTLRGRFDKHEGITLREVSNKIYGRFDFYGNPVHRFEEEINEDSTAVFRI